MIIERISANRLKGYATHLKNLSKDDKFTRFGHQISNDMIDKFILSILYSLESHYIFVAKDESNNPVGFVHLAKMNEDSWELAVSVNSDMQGSGVGNKLMDYAITWAKTHGIESMFMHCIVDNKKIQHLARKHGLRTVLRDGSDITAMVDLPSATIGDHLHSLLSEQTDIIKRIAGLNSKLFSNIITSYRNS